MHVEAVTPFHVLVLNAAQKSVHYEPEKYTAFKEDGRANKPKCSGNCNACGNAVDEDGPEEECAKGEEREVQGQRKEDTRAEQGTGQQHQEGGVIAGPLVFCF